MSGHNIAVVVACEAIAGCFTMPAPRIPTLEELAYAATAEKCEQVEYRCRTNRANQLEAVRRPKKTTPRFCLKQVEYISQGIPLKVEADNAPEHLGVLHEMHTILD